MGSLRQVWPMMGSAWRRRGRNEEGSLSDAAVGRGTKSDLAAALRARTWLDPFLSFLPPSSLTSPPLSPFLLEVLSLIKLA